MGYMATATTMDVTTETTAIAQFRIIGHLRLREKADVVMINLPWPAAPAMVFVDHCCII
jgi:hypothetical protein